MVLRQGQTGGERRLIGFDVVGNPLANQILQFDATNNRFIWIDPPSGNTFARVVKKVDEIVNNSTVLQDDNELVIAVLANKIYAGIMTLYVTSTTVADFKWGFSVPAGATGDRTQTDNWNTGIASNSNAIANSSNLSIPTAAVKVVMVQFRLIVGGAAGNFQLQWSQQNLEVADTKVLQGSLLVLWEELP